MFKQAASFVVASLLAMPSPGFAQLSPTADWAVHAQNQYHVIANVTYMTATGYESKLDVYKRRDVTTPQPSKTPPAPFDSWSTRPRTTALTPAA